jgi:hypothetical protein
MILRAASPAAGQGAGQPARISAGS